MICFANETNRSCNQILNIKQNYHQYVFVLIITILLTLALFNLGVCSQNDDFVTKKISLEVKNRPLAEVLKKLSNASGYEILFDNKYAELPVSICVKEKPVEQVLKRILKDQNVVILSDNNKMQISLWLPGSAVEQKVVCKIPAYPTQNKPSIDFKKYLSKVNTAAIETLPPRKMGGRGVTIAELKNDTTDITTLKDNEIEVLPPSASMKNGMNLAQFKEITNAAHIEKIDISTISALPPDAKNGRHITLADLQLLPDPPPSPKDLPR